MSGGRRKGYAVREPSAPQISVDEIRRLLGRFVFGSKRHVSVRALALEAHVSRQSIYQAWRGRAGSVVIDLLGNILRLMDQGVVGFEHVGEAFSSHDPLRWVSVLPTRHCPSGLDRCHGVLEHERCPLSGMAAWDCAASTDYQPPPKLRTVTRERAKVFNIRSIKSVLQQAREGRRLPKRYRAVVKEIADFRPAAKAPSARYEGQARDQSAGVSGIRALAFEMSSG